MRAPRDAAPFAGGPFRQESNARPPGCGTFRRRPVSARIATKPPICEVELGERMPLRRGWSPTTPRQQPAPRLPERRGASCQGSRTRPPCRAPRSHNASGDERLGEARRHARLVKPEGASPRSASDRVVPKLGVSGGGCTASRCVEGPTRVIFPRTALPDLPSRVLLSHGRIG
jgi:hypothetical protein